jgi:hypothetical protein
MPRWRKGVAMVVAVQTADSGLLLQCSTAERVGKVAADLQSHVGRQHCARSVTKPYQQDSQQGQANDKRNNACPSTRGWGCIHGGWQRRAHSAPIVHADAEQRNVCNVTDDCSVTWQQLSACTRSRVETNV